ncbi:hypothetical protein [Asticcacaulis sp. AC460]|uniref:hypothetical protein n=1 Tax=Asticcacaulis sp. AC460 TaxID=1282360 RepID=UPI0012DF3620|nr:hypothetical protein [Asticcacaulis sp. AC460]
MSKPPRAHEVVIDCQKLKALIERCGRTTNALAKDWNLAASTLHRMAGGRDDTPTATASVTNVGAVMKGARKTMLAKGETVGLNDLTDDYLLWTSGHDPNNAAPIYVEGSVGDPEGRLKLTTGTWPDDGLDLRIDFTPASLHEAISADVRLHSDNYTLWNIRFEHSAGTLGDGTHLLRKLDTVCLGSRAFIRLRRYYNEYYLTGFAALLRAKPYVPRMMTESAKISVVIISHSGEVLADKITSISSIDG